MGDPPAALRKPCCVCDAPGGKHCTKCKSRHYCGKKCQLVDWNERGHKVQCKQMAFEFQDALMLEKLKIKEELAIAADVAPAAVFKGAPRLSAVRAETTLVKATALNGDKPDWRGTCAICLDLLPVEPERQIFYDCCCKSLCRPCSDKCNEYDDRCPLCRALSFKSDAEWLRRMQKHVDEGNADAQMQLGDAYRDGDMGLTKSLERAFSLFERAAVQGFAEGQFALGMCYQLGNGVKIDLKTAARWYRRAAEQGYPVAQLNLGGMFANGTGVPRSQDEAVLWWRLAAAQGQPDALCNLGGCYGYGQGVPLDLDEALRLYKRAAAKGHAGAAAQAKKLAAWLAARDEAQ